MSTTPTFSAWLRQFVDEDSAIGDLAREVREDRRRHGYKGKTARGLRTHIRNRHGVYDGRVHEALDRAEEHYRAEIGAENR